MEEVRGFLDGFFFKEDTLCLVARAEFGQLFVPNFLPILVIKDDGSTFKGIVLTLCKLLQVTCRAVDPEN